MGVSLTENAQKQILDLGQAIPKDIRKRRISREKELTNRVQESSERPTRERLEELINQGLTGLAKRIILDYLCDNQDDFEMLEFLLFSQNELEIDDVSVWMERLLEVDSGNIAILEMELELRRVQGDQEGAKELSNRILNLDSGNIVALKFEIVRLQKSKEWQRLVDRCEELLKNIPGDRTAQRAVALAFSSLNDKRAYESWKKYSELPGVIEEEGYEISRVLYNGGYFIECIEILDLLKTEKSGDEEILELIARAHYSLENWKECYEISNELAGVSPENLTGLRLRMRSLRNLEDKKGMKVSAEKLLESKSHDDEAIRHLIQHSASVGDWGAVEDFTRIAIENSDLKEHTLRWHARALARQGKDAREAWGRLLNKQEDSEALIELGRISYLVFENVLANDYFDRAMAVNSNDPRVIRYSSSAKLRLGLLEEALPLVEEECLMNPHSVKAWEKLIETNLRLEDRANVDKIWRKILASTWDSTDSLMLGLEICLRFHWGGRFRWLIDTRTKHLPENSDLLGRMAEMYLEYGDIGSSWATLKKAPLGEISEGVKSRIREILDRLGLSEEELDEEVSNYHSVWITTLILKKVIEVRRISESRKSDKYSVALVSSSLNRGGAERQLVNTFNGIERDEFDCQLVVGRFDNRSNGETYLGLLGDNIDDAVEIFGGVIEDRPTGVSEEILALIEMLPSSTSKMVGGLLSHYCEDSPEIIHAWQDETILASSIASIILGIPSILGSARSMRPDEKSELHIRKRPHIKSCFQELIELPGFQLSTNSFAGRTSYSEWLEISEEKISVIHNGVDFEAMEKSIDIDVFQKKFRSFGIKEGHKVIGGVFRFESGKRIGLWLDSFEEALAKDGRLKGIIVGGGRLENSVRKSIEERGLQRRVHLTGAVEDVASWLKCMDIFLFCSSSEGLPNVLIEAQGFGVPVVTTDAGGCREVVEDGKTGFVLESDHPEKIAERVFTVLKGDKIEWSQRSMERARNEFSIEKMISNTQLAYLEDHLIEKEDVK